ncbi:MAG: hypothetical protein K0R66_314 [Gammaproteobacteria bacterium]|jgi:hypothetical protein|nr:hypothetical protein [Gammaproteobacteria bacterium]
MNAKKFLIVMLAIWLVKICHATPLSVVTGNNFKLSQSQASQVNVYPCLICPSSQLRTNSNCLTEAMQGGIGIHITF